MKVLFTCVGRRVELVQLFKQYFEVYGTDASKTAPALMFCDKTFKVPAICDENYVPELFRICKQEQIAVVIPTIDTDLLVLSRCRDLFDEANIRLLVSTYEMISLCRDKRKTVELFTKLGLRTPETVDDYRQYDLGYPAFIKPRDGSSSIFAFRVDTPEQLEMYAGQVPQYIIQPYVEGEEYTVDVFCDFDGRPIYITPRKRLAVRAGEVSKTEICQDLSIISDVEKLVETFKPCGAITVQLIKEKRTNRNWYIEINPRFGGGAPLSMMAGADAAKALYDLLIGKQLSYNPSVAENGAVFSRFDQSVRIV